MQAEDEARDCHWLPLKSADTPTRHQNKDMPWVHAARDGYAR